MIKSKEDYKEYFHADLVYTGIDSSLKTRIKDRRVKFYKLLRKTEYYTNCRKDICGRLYGKILRFRYLKLCDRYSWTIPINVFGKGIQIVHAGSIVVSGDAKIGNYARIHVGVNIGRAYAKGKDGAPTIGNRCYMGPGVKIFGPITIGDGVAIGANAVVNTSFPSNCTIAGVPANIISNKNSDYYIALGDRKTREEDKRKGFFSLK